MRARLRHRFILALSLVVGWAEAARAKVYLTPAEAARLAFGPEATVAEEQQVVTPAMRATLERRLGRPVPEDAFTFSVGRSAHGVDGYGLVLQEMGKHEPITLFVAVTPDGQVKDVMVLEYRESRGGEVRYHGFLKQYVGKTSRDPLELDEDITPITGATISARALSEGVKKALAVWELFYQSAKR